MPSFSSRYLSRAWLTVGLLCVVACLNYLDRVMLTTMRESVKEAIPMTEAQFGLLTSVFLWVYALLSPFAGFIADRFSRSKVIIGSLFVWSFVTWLTSHTTTFPQLLATRALMGVSEACYIPAALALIADYHRGPTRSLATGIHMVGISVGSGLGGLGGWLADKHDWTYAFHLFGLIGIGYSVVLLLGLRDAPAAPSSAGSGALPPRIRFGEALTSLFQRGSFTVAMLYWGLLGLSGWALVGWLPTFLGERFNLSQGTAGLSATGYLQPASWIGLLIGGAWADRWSRRDERGRIFVTIIGLCIVAPAIFFAVNAPALVFAIGGFMVSSFAMAFANANMMPILCLVTDERYRATGYGILNLFACVVGGLTIYLGGALRDADIPVTIVFECAAASVLVCAAMLWFIKPKPAAPAQ
jgi:MFS family permease